MTPSEIKDELARRTGIPRAAVALVLDTQEDILAECVIRRETCYIGSTFVIKSRYRDYSVLQNGKRALITRLAVNVKPRKPFRRKLNGKIRSPNKS